MKRLLFLVMVFALANMAVSQDYIFYGDYTNGNVYRADLNGEDITVIASGYLQVRTVTVDNKNFRVYWAVGTQGVYSANFDGSGLTQILNYGAIIGRIEFDYLNDRIFYTESFAGNIKSCNIDGTDIQLLVTGTGLIQGLGVDPGRQFIFWTDQDSGDIYRAYTDGTGQITIRETTTSLYDLELDVKYMKVYFSDRTNDEISVMNYDGSSVQSLINSNGVMGSMSTDFDDEYLYWIERENGYIKMSKLDGTEITTIINNQGSNMGGQDVTQNYFISGNRISETDQELQTYPNPCSRFIYCNNTSDAEIRIYSTDGKLVFKTRIDSCEPIDISALNNGTYILTCITEDDITTSKIVVKNEK